ncbi:hypothetical protein ATN89_22740 [Comamonas thiooxydans]|uniref:restriction endonuclease n=1 Tax=Comamonas thiooxydans TaxID=363952 RepID=UPI0007C4F247|nr:restriction endonuclease [Comamonas thiooxydans]OAD81818.1 hypothetical protein ATN89_22740 [Comamonas thiooxydans]
MAPINATSLDQELEAEILGLQSAIQMWAEDREIWHDAGFSSHLERCECEPNSEDPVITMFHAETAISVIMESELEVEFSKLLSDLGYWYEWDDAVTLAIYARDDDRKQRFFEYFYWQWVCSLLVEDTGDVYEELYGYFALHPEALHQVNWRSFEILLFRIFQNHGYQAILGPGRGDGGVDLRLWQQSPLGDVLTVVQAKRYAADRKIELMPVQALYGAAKAEGAANAMFVTTSSYMPAARNFASRVSQELHLAERDQIVEWCRKATHGVVKDKSTLISREAVVRLIEAISHHPHDPRIVHTTWGYNMTHNSYALVIKETNHAALLLSLRNRKISDDGYGTRGTEIPQLDLSALKQFNEIGVQRATRTVSIGGSVNYWTGSRLYSRWDGEPNSFDYMD